jgi:hypothetical protein
MTLLSGSFGLHLEHSTKEYGDDAPGMVDAITAAHKFYRRGLAEISPERVVVFVIG